MRHHLVRLGVGALAAGALLAPALPAAASTRTYPDRAGDAPAFLDVTGLKVSDATTRLAVKAIVPGFDPATVGTAADGTGDDFSNLILQVTIRGAKRSHVDVVLDASRPGGPIDRVELYRTFSNLFSRFDCAGVTSEVAAGSLKVSVPHACFGAERGHGAGDVRVKAILQGDEGSQGRWEGTYTTPWVRRG